MPLPLMGNSETIILLDSDPASAALLEPMFTSLGFRVRLYVSAESFFAAGRPMMPACLLLELKLGDMSGVEVQMHLGRLGWDLPLIFLSGCSEVATAVRAIRAGAEDFLTKPCPPEDILRAVQRALESSRTNARVGHEIVELRRRAGLLTAREREVICLVVAGMLNKQVAEQLKLALVTVKVHRGNAMRKLGARNPAELTRMARAAGICEIDFSSPPLTLVSRSERKWL